MKDALLLSGAVLAMAALIAQNRYGRFEELLTPNTFASREYITILINNRKYQAAGGWIFLLLAILGVLIGVYGSLV